MGHRNAEYDFANDATFQKRLAMAMVAKANAVIAEALLAGHPQTSQKRWALAAAVLQGSAAYVPRFAQAVIAYTGSPVGASVDFAYDGHAPGDGNNPTAGETATISTFSNNGMTDAQIDTAVAAVWSPIAGVLPTD